MSTDDEPTDAALLAAAKAGDVTAFGELVRRHQRAARRVAAVALGSAEGADDVVQEAFVRAHAALSSFRLEAPLKPWLFRIVTNTARNRQRRAGRQRALAVRAGSRVGVGGPLPPDEAAVRQTEREAVIAAINRLRPDDRLILTYRWYEELTEAEIAEAMGCRPGTVKSRLHRAMGRLRDQLEER